MDTPVFEKGALVLIDGRAWTVEEFKGHAVIAVSEDGKRIAFDAREVQYIGAGLFGLPGRLEPKAVNPNATVVAQTAVASMTVVQP